MRAEHVLLASGLVLLVVGQAMGLFWTPPEMHMGDAGRMLYTHVPPAILAMMAFMMASVFALLSLFVPRPRWDHGLVACVEVGVLHNFLLLALGSIWSKPTFGVWWAWEPRITFSTIMFVGFAGVLLLRQVVDDADKRSLWSAVTTVMSSVTVPLTYFVVTKVATLHQELSTPESLSAPMLLTLRVNLFAMVLLTLWFVAVRMRVAASRWADEAPPPLPGMSPGGAA